MRAEHFTTTRVCTRTLLPDPLWHECRRTVLPFALVTTVAQLLAVKVADELLRAGPTVTPLDPEPMPRNRSRESSSRSSPTCAMLRRGQHPVEQRQRPGLVQRLVQVPALR